MCLCTMLQSLRHLSISHICLFHSQCFKSFNSLFVSNAVACGLEGPGCEASVKHLSEVFTGLLRFDLFPEVVPQVKEIENFEGHVGIFAIFHQSFY